MMMEYRTKNTNNQGPKVHYGQFIINKPITKIMNNGTIVKKDEKQEFSDRLNYILDKAGLPPINKGRQKILAKLFEVTPKGAQKWLTGEAIPHRTKSLPAIIREYKDTGVTAEWLLTGNPDYHPEKIIRSKLNRYHNNIKITLKFAPVPVVADSHFGDNDNWTKPIIIKEGGFIIFPGASSNSYVYHQLGDLLSPRVKDGEFLVIDPEKIPEPGDEVLIKNNEGEFIIKKLLYIRDNKAHLMSINEIGAPTSYQVDNIEYIHKILAIANKSLWSIEG